MSERSDSLESLVLRQGTAPPGVLEAVATLATSSGLEIAPAFKPNIDDLYVGLSDFQDTAIKFGFNDKSKGTNSWITVVRAEVDAHNLEIEGQPKPDNKLRFTRYPGEEGVWTMYDHWESFGDLSLSSLEKYLQTIRAKLDPSDPRVDAIKYQFKNIGPKGMGPATVHFLESFVELRQRQVE
jgi:hypothetical protein